MSAGDGPGPRFHRGSAEDGFRPSVLLTGATGFLGMEVLVRLLERTDRDVLCLVRAAGEAEAEERLDGVLATLYGDASLHRSRVRALPGDLTGEVEPPAQPIDVVCHCAASISFDLPLEEARRINVEGTRTMLELARAAGARRFVHVSTAYVAGTHRGRFTEDMLGSEFRNTYEQSKCEAERLVEAAEGLEVAIARPSIVVGESDSGWTPAFNVLYWPLRAFGRGLLGPLPAKPEGLVDVVPVDYVADGIAKLIEASETGTFNLVSGSEAPTVHEVSGLACAHFDRPRPPYAPSGDFGDAAVEEHGAVYLPYFDMDVEFDDSRTRERLGLSAPPLPAYFETLMDYADAARWGKRAITREAARARVAQPTR